ncbi:hypothetical protein K432DRAFT_254382, partial [Lepidopterella palustris CBS 459.81]
STNSLPPSLQNTLYTALLSTTAIPTIQNTLTHELQASGWTSNLRTYIQQLLRSGECTTYNEANGTATNGMNGSGHKGGSNVAGGEWAKNVEDGGIKIPERAVREGVRVVRKELEKVVEITVEGEDK